MLRSVSNPTDYLPPFGNHIWPFSFRLDNSLPPSLGQTYSVTQVNYFIRFMFERPGWFKNNIRKDIPIIIQHLSSPVNTKQVEKQKKNWKDTRLHIVLRKDVVAVGNTLSFELDLQNPKQAMIRRIWVSLVQVHSLGPGNGWRVLVKQKLEGIDSFKGKYFHKTFQLPVPNRAIPTCSLYFGSVFNKKPFAVHHQLRIEARNRGLFTNLYLRLPLTVITTNQTKNG
jgi:hypothetical protein